MRRAVIGTGTAILLWSIRFRTPSSEARPGSSLDENIYLVLDVMQAVNLYDQGA